MTNADDPLGLMKEETKHLTKTPFFSHQKITFRELRLKPRLFDTSDPGTGKTRPAIAAFVERRQAGGKKAFVLAPKSILQSAWGNEIDKFFPGVKYSIAYASNRRAAFMAEADIYLTNHDAIRWIVRLDGLPKHYWDDFDTLIVDESTAFKNPSAGRAKALKKIANRFEFRELMTGTPNPNSVLELWLQAYILDDGARLGPSFYQFRNSVCRPVQVGPSPNHIEWRDKPGAEEAVYDLLSDIMVRHRFEECVDIPANHSYDIIFDMPPNQRRQYEEMVHTARAELAAGKILNAIHAASVNTKALQIASGAVYTGANYEVLDTSRTELILDLVEQRKHSLVVFLWTHQREQLVKEANKRGIKHAVIDGSVTDAMQRTNIVQNYQDGKYQALFIHPQSAGHGLTLTRGTTTIWASPTYNSEHYKQVKHRIYRTGQTEKTETIHIVARDTLEEKVNARRNDKLKSMDLFLGLAEDPK